MESYFSHSMKGSPGREAIDETPSIKVNHNPDPQHDFRSISNTRLCIYVILLILVNIPYGICYCLVKEWKLALGFWLVFGYLLYMNNFLTIAEEEKL